MIENKLPKSMCVSLPPKKKDGSLTISFLGVVRHATIMENLMKAIKDMDDVQFKIFGGGPFYTQIKEIADRYNNVTMYGSYEYNEIPSIYAQSDLIWAVYPYHDYNVKLAISNKYHETIHYEVPGIFCKGTKLGDMVAKEKLGIAVDCDSVVDIRNEILKFKENQDACLQNIKQNISNQKIMETSCWEDEIKPFITYLTQGK